MRALSTVLAFAGKEMRQVLRQPKLMAVLILGPFLILGLFAAGFQATPPPLRTLVVLPEGSELESSMPQIAEQIGSEIELVGTLGDTGEARQRLLDGEVDLVVEAPADAATTVRNDEQATVVVYHNRLDPFDRAYITVAAQSAVDELNRMVLARVAATAQDRAGEYEEAIPTARQAMGTMATALREGDEAGAREAQSQAVDSLTLAEQQLGLTADFFLGVDETAGSSAATLGERVGSSRGEVESIDSSDPAAADRAERMEGELAELEAAIAEFRSVSPQVLVQPFVADTELASGIDVPLTAYYSPGVVAVLLQHVVLTFAALSVVNERSTGSTELFRVGPVRLGEFLAGKFLGYAVLGSVVAAALIAVVVFAFGTPMAGSWLWAAAVLALTMAASLGLGFVIAAAANTDAQAVQFSMMALLFTIFFSGMVVSLSRLADGVRQIAYLSPATAGTTALQDVMFLGNEPNALALAVLGAYVVVSFGIAYMWLRRRQVA
ncbi:MAG: ABC transporter permease [Actinomycetes bacterium]|jgi:ABC-2 type transport system permease protein|nr:hypothetical protein [Acidimicrobiia bacterium]